MNKMLTFLIIGILFPGTLKIIIKSLNINRTLNSRFLFERYWAIVNHHECTAQIDECQVFDFYSTTAVEF